MTHKGRCIYLRGTQGNNVWGMMRKKEGKGEKEGTLESIAKLETGKLYNFEKRKEVVDMIYRVAEGFGWGNIAAESAVKTLEKIIIHNMTTIPEWEVNLLAASVLYISAQYSENTRKTCHITPSEFLREAKLGPTVSSHRLVSMTQTVLNYHTSVDISIPPASSFLNAAVCSLIPFKDCIPIPKLITPQSMSTPLASHPEVGQSRSQRLVIRVCTPDSSCSNLIYKSVSILASASLASQTTMIGQKLGICQDKLAREPLRLYTVTGIQDSEIVTARRVALRESASQLGWTSEQQVFACLNENNSFMCMSGEVGIPHLSNTRFLRECNKILTALVKNPIHMLMKSSQLAAVSLCLCKIFNCYDIEGNIKFVEYLHDRLGVDIKDLLRIHGHHLIKICKEAEVECSDEPEGRLHALLTPTGDECMATPGSSSSSSCYGITPEGSSASTPPALLPLEEVPVPSVTPTRPTPSKAPMLALKSMYHNFRSKKKTRFSPPRIRPFQPILFLTFNMKMT
eukprot:TRINITY_DN10630_c1_g1_i1.p1 TRINITY_DN10630_c1_g1~~TRINITY_DN10630_c1_g1_i1.p1  ORF type:complete len:512 (+),score=62.12 TRINITY_DN10630_c1_g1_i1:52-1587(+)